MIKKIISIKNIGRFINSATQGNPPLAKYTLISGANGYGKTTLCAILRSLQTGDAAHIIGRKTLGVTDLPIVELLIESSAVKFNGSTWKETLRNIHIFDNTFIAENVHSGEVVEIAHKRNLYHVIIGAEGVHLAKEDARLATESRAKTGEITATAKSIQSFVPMGMTLEQFLALPIAPEIETKITEQEQTLVAVRQANQIQIRVALSEIILPTLPDGLTELLNRTIDDIAADAERQVADHLVKHSMKANGQTWLADGMAHMSVETCPFCGQNIHKSPLIAAYKAVFSNTYKNLKGEIANFQNKIDLLFGEAAIGKLETLAEQNRGSVDFWSRFCPFDVVPLSMPAEVSEAVRTLRQTTLALFTQKTGSPLEPVALNDTFNSALAAYKCVHDAVGRVNIAIRAVNALIENKKKEIGTADVKAAEAELARRKATKKRHEAAVAQDCANHKHLTGEKNAIDKAKTEIRAKLEAHTKRVVKPYEQQINKYLDTFNAGFRLTETKHSYPGGMATSSYQLVINNIPIELGDGNTPHDQPSFKNTLSAGDRTTLALAFFLAHLDRDADRALKIVVLDDPFNSQDAYRRRQTVYEIKKVGKDCTQVIVLSHDVTFLKQVWEKLPLNERVAIQITDARDQGSKILSIDLDKACQGRIANEVDDLQAFLATGAGKTLDLIKKMRIVLETHFFTTYPALFEANDWLGVIVGKIRDGGENHPVQALYDELDKINDYTKEFHHGKDVANSNTDQIDPTELTGFVKRTLRMVNASQA